MSCRLSKRGHAWQPPRLAARCLRPAPHVRTCACGAIGYVNKQGVVEVDWEPVVLGTLAIAHPCDREEVRRVVLELGENEASYRAGERGPASYLAAREDLLKQLLAVLG